MLQNKAYKYRIYPTEEQKVLIEKTFGCSRLVYNHLLFLSKQTKYMGYTQSSAVITNLKKLEDYVFLKEVDSMALQESARDLQRAYNNFFRKEHRAGKPIYKTKHNKVLSYRTRNQSNGIRIVSKSYIKVPKLGNIKFANSRYCKGTILNATISKSSTNKYYISLCCVEDIEPLPANTNTIALDIGLKSFYTDSNGNKVENHKFNRKQQNKLKRTQRVLSRRVKGSQNYLKQKNRGAKLHEKVRNQRNDFLHKESLRLIKENQIICLEDLKVKNMVKNHKLAFSIEDASFSKFKEMLYYKAKWYGRIISEIDTFYPSSQLCSNCGYKNPNTKDLKIRKWICPQCGVEHDRDHNAAINILNEGLRLLYIS